MVFPSLRVNEVNRATLTIEGATGKSVNVAKVLQTLGLNPVATGFLGGNRGAFVAGVLDRRMIRREFVEVSSAETRECTTVIDESTGAQTELVEESRPVPAECYDQLMEKIRRLAPGCLALVMSGSITPGGPAGLYHTCALLAREVGAMPVVDASGPLLLQALPARPALVKPNRKELAVTLGLDPHDLPQIQDAARQFHARGAERVVVTAGKEPTLAFDGRTFWQIRNPQIKALNPIGSGDSFTAALVKALLEGHDLGEACRWGAAAGAANALSLMPADLERREVEALLPEVLVERIPG